MNKLKLDSCERQFDQRPIQCKGIGLVECLERKLLISPDSNKKLYMNEIEEKISLTDGLLTYGINNQSPVLYPMSISECWIDGVLPFSCEYGPLNQYALLSQIKQSGEINSPQQSVPARKHQYRLMDFIKNVKGLVLDVGSDRPSLSMQLLPKDCEYLGLDPYAGRGEFRVIGLGEVLPIQSHSVDAVLFNTSLDHMLDYHTAIEEACRVLKPGGVIVIATYAWIERASLLTDSVHFHHFREFEILGSLEKNFLIKNICRYEDPKHAKHRYGLYVMGAIK